MRHVTRARANLVRARKKLSCDWTSAFVRARKAFVRAPNMPLVRAPNMSLERRAWIVRALLVAAVTWPGALEFKLHLRAAGAWSCRGCGSPLSWSVMDVSGPGSARWRDILDDDSSGAHSDAPDEPVDGVDDGSHSSSSDDDSSEERADFADARAAQKALRQRACRLGARRLAVRWRVRGRGVNSTPWCPFYVHVSVPMASSIA